MNYGNMLNIVIVGPNSSGKTTLYNSYMNQDKEDNEYLTQSLGYTTSTRNIELNKQLITISLFDLTNINEPLGITKGLDRNVDGYIVLYSITSLSTFEDVSDWIARIKECSYLPLMILVGNKSDLALERKVGNEESVDLAKKHSIKYYELSAKYNINVNETIKEFIEVLLIESNRIKELNRTNDSNQDNPANVTTVENEYEKPLEGMIMKSLMIGDSGVGKTSLLYSYTDKKNMKASTFVKSIIYKLKEIKFSSQDVTLQIFDFPSRFDVKKNVEYFRDCAVIYLIYSISNRNSFNEIKNYFNQIQKENRIVLLCLIGNMNDQTTKREVSTEEGKEFAKKNSIPFYELNCFNSEETLRKPFELFVAGYISKEKERTRIDRESTGLTKYKK